MMFSAVSREMPASWATVIASELRAIENSRAPASPLSRAEVRAPVHQLMAM